MHGVTNDHSDAGVCAAVKQGEDLPRSLLASDSEAQWQKSFLLCQLAEHDPMAIRFVFSLI